MTRLRSDHVTVCKVSAPRRVQRPGQWPDERPERTSDMGDSTLSACPDTGILHAFGSGS